MFRLSILILALCLAGCASTPKETIKLELPEVEYSR